MFGEMLSARSAKMIDTEEFLPPLGWRQQDQAGLTAHSSGLSLIPWIPNLYSAHEGFDLGYHYTSVSL